VIGFVLPTELAKSKIPRELKIVEFYNSFGSLAEVISGSPEWWTATVEAKAIVGIVLGLRFLHSYGLVHNNLNSNNIFFDMNHHIQIGGIGYVGQEVYERERENEKERINFFEILFNRPIDSGTPISTDIPKFVSKIITAGFCMKSELQLTFWKIFEILKKNQYAIMEEVNLQEVRLFSKWVEFIEHP
jgi:serine/threonine protein kinase